MSAQTRVLKARKAELVKAAGTLNAITDRDLTADEQATLNQHLADIGALNQRIAAAEALANEEAGLSASGAVEIGAAGTIAVTENIAQDPKRGFNSFGDFATSVRRASGGRNMDERLRIGAAAPSTFGSEAAGADGGFLVPPQFSTEIFNLAFTEDSLLPMVDNVTTSSNSMVFPKDETTPWGTDGVRAYWQAEATAATATKPKFGTSVMRLHKLMGLVPLTDELLADTNALEAYLPNLLGRSIRWKTNEAFLWGNGDGQPLGMFTGAAAVTQAKDSGQAASTVSTTNCTNMIARLPPGSYPRSVWMITPDALSALFSLTLGNYPIYLPTASGNAGGLQTNPYGQLLGRPIIVSQHAAAFSATGDILLLDPMFYRALTSGAGVQMASSMHLYFDADATAFRATFRVDGQPKIAAAISQAKGSNTLSPFVQLATR